MHTPTHTHTLCSHLLRRGWGGETDRLQKNVENDNRMRLRKKPRLFAISILFAHIDRIEASWPDYAYACVHIKNTVKYGDAGKKRRSSERSATEKPRGKVGRSYFELEFCYFSLIASGYSGHMK